MDSLIILSSLKDHSYINKGQGSETSTVTLPLPVRKNKTPPFDTKNK